MSYQQIHPLRDVPSEGQVCFGPFDPEELDRIESTLSYWNHYDNGPNISFGYADETGHLYFTYHNPQSLAECLEEQCIDDMLPNIDFSYTIYKPTKIGDYVKKRTVSFQYFRDGELWYQVDGTKLIFPVPTDSNEVGHATFNASDKAMIFMRYIRKYLDSMEKAREEQAMNGSTEDLFVDGQSYCFYDDDGKSASCLIEGTDRNPGDCMHANDHDITKKEDCEFWKKLTVVKL